MRIESWKEQNQNVIDGRQITNKYFLGLLSATVIAHFESEEPKKANNIFSFYSAENILWKKTRDLVRRETYLEKTGNLSF